MAVSLKIIVLSFVITFIEVLHIYFLCVRRLELVETVAKYSKQMWLAILFPSVEALLSNCLHVVKVMLNVILIGPC